jgi:hypothetical protein
VLIFLVLARIFLNFPDTDDDNVWEQWEGLGLTVAFVAGGSAIYYLSHALI